MAIIGKGGPTLDRMICIAGPTASGKTELAVALALSGVVAKMAREDDHDLRR